MYSSSVERTKTPAKCVKIVKNASRSRILGNDFKAEQPKQHNAQNCRSANVTNVEDLCNAKVFEKKTYLYVIKNKIITKDLFVLKFLIF
jgi:hypothetical protein